MDGIRAHRWRFLVLTSVALLAGCRTYSDKNLTVPQATYLQHPPQYYPPQATVRAQNPAPPQARPATPSGETMCKVYLLADLGHDSQFCEWVAGTIPQMVQPESWAGGSARLAYHAPSRTLVINHTAAVHAQIAGLLESLKKAAPVVRTSHREPRPRTTSATPKHLFHFIIRAEGDGCIDANVQELAELQSGVPLGVLNQYSSDPAARIEQLTKDPENLRQIQDEWQRFWMNDQPAHLTPLRVHDSQGPPIEKTNVPRMPPAD